MQSKTFEMYSGRTSSTLCTKFGDFTLTWKICKISDFFESAAFSALVNGNILKTFLRSGFAGSGPYIPPQNRPTYCMKFANYVGAKSFNCVKMKGTFYDVAFWLVLIS